ALAEAFRRFRRLDRMAIAKPRGDITAQPRNESDDSANDRGAQGQTPVPEDIETTFPHIAHGVAESAGIIVIGKISPRRQGDHLGAGADSAPGSSRNGPVSRNSRDTGSVGLR